MSVKWPFFGGGGKCIAGDVVWSGHLRMHASTRLAPVK